MTPHFQDVFEGEDPDDVVQYAVDLIDAAGGPSDTFMNNDPLATAIHDVYRNGAEAALRHLGRAIELYATFEARRRTERLVKEARRLSPSAFPTRHEGRSQRPEHIQRRRVGSYSAALPAWAAG